LAVNRQTAQKFDEERFYLRQLNELEVRKEYKIEIKNRFASLENSSDVEDINRAWENIKDNIKPQLKTSLGLHEKKQAKMQWVQDPSQSNVDILNNVHVKLADISGKKKRRNI